MTDELVLEMRGIRKEFPGTVANDNVDLEVRRGEVHALLGENGAGKSTLMNILYGLYRPDAGELLLNGKRVEFSSARDAIGAGIGMVHQHFMLIPVMTVAENIVLGVEPRHNLLLDEHTARTARTGALRAFLTGRRSGGAGERHHGRSGAARRDLEGAVSRRGHPDPRRADRGADPAGGTRALRDHPKPASRRQVDHLHQPQAERGARDRRSHHGAPPWQEDRDGFERGSDRGVARPGDGGTRCAAPGREDPGAAGGGAAGRARPPRQRRPWDSEGARRVVRGPRGRDRRPGRRRRQRPDGADRGDHRAPEE